MVLQTNLLNEGHPSTIICPVTTKVHRSAEILRVHLSRHESGLEKESDLMVDQIRTIDNQRFRKRLGKLSLSEQKKVTANLKIILFE